ncbi:MAG: DUF5074 domain-containing protein [Sphingobacteriaceae bacterium]
MRTNNFLHHFATFTVIAGCFALITSCKKDKKEDQKPIPEVTAGVYVLNQGGISHNSSSLTYYDFKGKSVLPNIFAAVNPNQEALGDVGQDLQIYGSKMYIIVNVSSKIEVVDAKSAKSIKTIPMGTAPNLKSPRYLAFHQNKAFISATDGTVSVLDTATLIIEKTINVGRNPEQMAVVGNKLYVANSGGYDAPNYDNTVSVIDLNTMKEVKKITVGINLEKLQADPYGDVYVTSRGNYGDVASNLFVIDTKTDAVKKQFDLEIGDFVINGNLAYTYSYSFVTGKATYIILNVENETVVSNNFITDGTDTDILTPYGLAIDPLSGDIYVADAKDYSNSGTVYCFDKNGKKKFSFQAGQIPAFFAFYKN